MAAGGASGVLGTIGAIQGTGGLAPLLSGAAPIASSVGMGVLASHGALRALDAATGARNPTRELTRRFSDSEGSITNPTAKPSLTKTLESAQEQAVNDAAQKKLADTVSKEVSKRTSKLDSQEAAQDKSVQARSDQMDREAAAAEKQKKADLEKAFPKTALAKLTQAQQQQIDARNAPAVMDPRRKAAQEDAMWAANEPRAPQDAPNADLQAQAAIKQAYAQRQAESEAAVLPGMKQRAALKKLKEAQMAAQTAADEKASKQKQKDLEKAFPKPAVAELKPAQQRQVEARNALPTLDARRKAAQEDAMWSQHEPSTQQDSPEVDLQAQAAIKQAYKERRAESDAAVLPGMKMRAALRKLQAQADATKDKEANKASQKTQETDQAKPKATEAKPEKAASEAPRASAEAPDVVHHLGVDIIVPKDVVNREAYINSAKKKQDNLQSHIEDGANLDGISRKTTDNLLDVETKIRAARNQKDAEVLLEQVYAHATKDERHILKAHFDNKKFYALWRK